MKKGVGDDPFAEEEPGEDDGKTEETTTEMSQIPQTESERPDSFVSAITQSFEEIESGEESKSVSFRDTSIKALLLALEEDDEARQRLVDDLALSGGADRSDIVRGLIRAGLENESRETFEELGEARAEHARDSI